MFFFINLIARIITVIDKETIVQKAHGAMPKTSYKVGPLNVGPSPPITVIAALIHFISLPLKQILPYYIMQKNKKSSKGRKK